MQTSSYLADNCTAVKMLPIAKTQRSENQHLAIVLAAKQKSPIFTLDVDCFGALFEYLTLEELCSIGLTCKYLQHVAGEYFAEFFPFTNVNFNRRGDQFMSDSLICRTNFAPYARYVAFDRGDIDFYRIVADVKYRYMRHVEFGESRDFTEEHYSCIKKMNILSKVTAMDVRASPAKFRDRLLSRILGSCTKLRNLNLTYTYKEQMVANSTGTSWINQRCPTLERLEFMEEELSDDELKRFLRANPQIKVLSGPGNPTLLKIIEEMDIKLDELEYKVGGEDGPVEEATCQKLMEMNQKGHFKRLRIWFACYEDYDEDMRHIRDLKGVNCITSAKVECIDYGICKNHNVKSIALLVNLKQLHFSPQMSLRNAEFLSQKLTELEELYLEGNSLLEAIPFARCLPKLRIIEARYKSKSNINLETLNADRKKLPNAQTLKIFLEDEAYHQIRWTSVDLFLDMVEVKRLISTKDKTI